MSETDVRFEWVIDQLNDLLWLSLFKDADELLESIPMDRLDAQNVLTILEITREHKDKLKYRNTFKTRVKNAGYL